jgi:hypothetical protein
MNCSFSVFQPATRQRHQGFDGVHLEAAARFEKRRRGFDAAPVRTTLDGKRAE